MPSAQTVAAIAAAAGGAARSAQRVAGAPVVRLAFRDGWQAARALGALAREDASDPEIARLGATFRALCPAMQERARRMLEFVQAHVTFAREPVETFQSARVTLQRGAGDCDDSARLLFALARAAGIPARLAFLAVRNEPVHVFCELWTGRSYEAAETTIRGARLGEQPQQAARRLGVRMRPDLSAGPSIAMLGALHDLATTSQTWTLPQGPVAVRLALDVPALQSDADLLDGMRAIDLADAQIFDSRDASSAEWPAAWLTMRPSDPARRIVLVWGRYAGAPRQLSRDVSSPVYTVRAAQSNDDATPPTTTGIDMNNPPPVPPMPPASEPRSPWARIVVAHAWPKVHPTRVLTEGMADLVVAVAALETQILRASQGTYNWGNLHGGKLAAGASCPAGTTQGTDRDASGNTYQTCFRAYPDAVTGMVDYLKVLTRGAALAALESGNPDALAAAMKANGYFQADLATYQKALRENLATVQRNLDKAKTAAGASWYVLPAVTLVALASWYAATKG